MRGAGEKYGLPSYAREERVESRDTSPRRRTKLPRALRLVLVATLSLATLQYLGFSTRFRDASDGVQLPLHAHEWLEKCQLLDVPPGPPPDFYERKLSDRFVPGTMPTFITVLSSFSPVKLLLLMILLHTERYDLDRWQQWHGSNPGRHSP